MVSGVIKNFEIGCKWLVILFIVVWVLVVWKLLIRRLERFFWGGVILILLF